VVENVRHGAQTAPINERQVRPSPVSHCRSPLVAWQMAVDTIHDGKITAAEIVHAGDNMSKSGNYGGQ